MRYELQLATIESIVFKRVLKWIAKILGMGQERYPKVMLLVLFNLDTGGNLAKFNWLSLVKSTFFAAIGELEFFNNWEAFTELACGKVRDSLLSKYANFVKARDKSSCTLSSALLNYPFCITENLNNAYLVTPRNLLFKREMAQLRLLNKYCNRMILKNKVYALRMLDVCEFCNSENLSIIHWICECPLLDAERINFNSPELCSHNVNSLSLLLLATDEI